MAVPTDRTEISKLMDALASAIDAEQQQAIREMVERELCSTYGTPVVWRTEPEGQQTLQISGHRLAISGDEGEYVATWDNAPLGERESSDHYDQARAIVEEVVSKLGRAKYEPPAGVRIVRFNCVSPSSMYGCACLPVGEDGKISLAIERSETEHGSYGNVIASSLAAGQKHERWLMAVPK